MGSFAEDTKEFAREQAPIIASSKSRLGIAYASTSIDELVNQILRLRTCDLPLLITGESGVGKELFAQAVHQVSTRHINPFVPFNCSTVQRSLIASHLFGHKKGSFTGADRDHIGIIRSAEGGTIFLDEVGEIPLDVQPHLLRFLESSDVMPLGESVPRRVNVRVIAATNRDLEAMVREGTFRRDLYFRLNALRLRVPALRDRKEDIPVLVQHFLTSFNHRHEHPVKFTEDAVTLLATCNFPGNVRQLKNTVERLAVLSDGVVSGREIRYEMRHESGITQLRPPNAGLGTMDVPHGVTLADAMDHVEAELIRRALIEAPSVVAAARQLGLSRSTLYDKMKRLSIEPQKVRSSAL